MSNEAWLKRQILNSRKSAAAVLEEMVKAGWSPNTTLAEAVKFLSRDDVDTDSAAPPSGEKAGE